MDEIYGIKTCQISATTTTQQTQHDFIMDDMDDMDEMIDINWI